MTTDALFPLPDDWTPPPPAHPESRGARRQRLVDARIASGTHPLGYVALHPDAAAGRDDGPGLRCNTCRFRQLLSHHNRTYPKCMKGDGIRATACESSDIRAWWPACRDYEPNTPTDSRDE